MTVFRTKKKWMKVPIAWKNHTHQKQHLIQIQRQKSPKKIRDDGVIDSDDDGLPNEYDLTDSFIDSSEDFGYTSKIRKPEKEKIQPKSQQNLSFQPKEKKEKPAIVNSDSESEDTQPISSSELEADMKMLSNELTKLAQSATNKADKILDIDNASDSSENTDVMEDKEIEEIIKPVNQRLEKSDSDTENMDGIEESKKGDDENTQEMQEADKGSPESGGTDAMSDTEIQKEIEKATQQLTDNDQHSQNVDYVLDTLPSLFQGEQFFIYGPCNPSQARLLRRSIVAYGGKIDQYFNQPGNPKTTVVITNQGWNSVFQNAIKDNPSLKIVKPEWVIKCCEQQKVVSTQLFLVKKD